jgi:hypothetical protein
MTELRAHAIHASAAMSAPRAIYRPSIRESYIVDYQI